MRKLRLNSFGPARLAVALLTAVMLSACNVYEWYEEEPLPGPEPPPEPETPAFVLHLDFDTEMPLHQEIAWSRAATDAHDVRHQVMIYSGTGEITASSVPVRTLTLTGESTTLNRDVEIDLEEGQYSFLVWSDYVDQGSMIDKYYTTGSLSAITLADRNNHPGSNPYRDAFRGQTTGTVVKGVGGSATVPMKRPMGRFEFITTDLEEFVARAVAARNAAEGRSGDGGDDKAETESGGDKAETESDDSRADISGYKVTFVYTGFMPSTYNIYSDKPTDAWTGMKFDSQFESLSDGTRMGYDYVMVNGSETSVSVAVQVKDENGNVIATTPSIDVPIVRSKLTVVKGEFMSSTSAGGVVVDPGFDGEFNIEIR